MIAFWLCQTDFNKHTLLLHIQHAPALLQFVIPSEYLETNRNQQIDRDWTFNERAEQLHPLNSVIRNPNNRAPKITHWMCEACKWC